MANTTVIMKGPTQPSGGNTPPVITSTPNPEFVEGVAATYDMSQHFTDDGASTVTSNTGGGGSLSDVPGATYNGTTHTLSYNGATGTGAFNKTLFVDDGVNDPVSVDFTIRINSASASFGVTQGDPGYLSIIPGARGWGMHTVGGSGRHLGAPATTVLYVDSLSTGNSGSGNSGTLLWCLTRSFPRTIIPKVSGLVNFSSTGVVTITNPYMTYAGQCAPSPGLHVFNLNMKINASDIVLWHWSGWMGIAPDQGRGDNIQIGVGGSNISKIVLANCNAMMGADEGVSIDIQSGSSITDVCVWQSMIAYGQWEAPNVAGDGFGQIIYLTGSSDHRASVLRTYFAHNRHRNPKGRGGFIQSSNNLCYNNLIGSDFATMTQAIAARSNWNISGNGFVRGPNSNDANNSILWLNGQQNHYQFHANHCFIGNIAWSSDFVNVPANGIRNDPGQTIAASASSAVTPPGFVLRALTETDAGLLEFAQVMEQHVGARPTDRLSHAQGAINHVINRLDGVGAQGSAIGIPSDLGWPITIANNQVDHESPSAHGGDPIPISTFSNIDSSTGYTVGELWLQRRNGDVMPAGWEQ